MLRGRWLALATIACLKDSATVESVTSSGLSSVKPVALSSTPKSLVFFCQKLGLIRAFFPAAGRCWRTYVSSRLMPLTCWWCMVTPDTVAG